MKLLSVIIPCYNSAEYMERAIKSALAGGEEVEVLVIDDGSTDDTLKIANEMQSKYPSLRAIHQENGGHGCAVNTGLANATGLYVKVLDSDDWFDYTAFTNVLHKLRELVEDGNPVDMMICNYVYEKLHVSKHKIMSYSHALPKDKIIGWKQVRSFRMHQNLIMHSLIFRTKILKDCGLQLPEHCFYVDNIFSFVPLPHVKTMYYLDENLYRYYIGREDQSVNEEIMIQRIDQQIHITKLLIDYYNDATVKDKALRKYMIKFLAMMMIVSSALLIKEGSHESLDKRDELWNYLKKGNLPVYYFISRYKLGYPLQVKSRSGRRMVIWGYHIFRQIYGFN